jgi:hypothetical protein
MNVTIGLIEAKQRLASGITTSGVGSKHWRLDASDPLADWPETFMDFKEQVCFLTFSEPFL